MATKTADNDKTMAIVSYFVFFLPLIMGNKSSFVKFHANQALVLVIGWIAVNILAVIVPVLGGMISMIVGLAILVLWIMGILSASKNETKPLPVVGGIKILS